MFLPRVASCTTVITTRKNDGMGSYAKVYKYGNISCHAKKVLHIAEQRNNDKDQANCYASLTLTNRILLNL